MIQRLLRPARFCTILLLASAPAVAFGGTLAARAEAGDKVVLADLEAKSPPAAKLVRDAQKATAEGEHLAAYNLLKAAFALLPEHPALMRRTALAAFRIDRRDEAILLARRTVVLDPSAENRVALAQILARTEDAEDGQEASKLIVVAADELPEDPLAQGICCVITARLGPRDALHRCTNRYLATAPDEGEAHFYGAVAALERDDVAVAQKEIAKAKELGLALPMVAAIEGRVAALRPPAKAVNQSVALTTQLLPLVYPLSLALLYVVRERLRSRVRGSLSDPRAQKPLGDRLDRGALQALLAIFFVCHFLLLPVVVGLLLGATVVVLAGPSTVTFAAAAVLALTASAALLQSVAADGTIGEVESLPDGLEAATQDTAGRVGTYPAELLRRTRKGFVDVIEETSLLGRTKGEAVRTLVLGDAATALSKGDLRAALAHAHARIATKDVTTASAAGLLAWLERTAEAVPRALLVRAARFLIGPVLVVAAERQSREADAVVTYAYGAEALDRVLVGLSIPKAERNARVAAAKALALAPRALEDDDDDAATPWFERAATGG